MKPKTWDLKAWCRVRIEHFLQGWPCHITLVQLTSGKLWRYRSQQQQKVQNIPRSGDQWANSWLSPSLADLKFKLFFIRTIQDFCVQNPNLPRFNCILILKLSQSLSCLSVRQIMTLCSEQNPPKRLDLILFTKFLYEKLMKRNRSSTWYNLSSGLNPVLSTNEQKWLIIMWHWHLLYIE